MKTSKACARQVFLNCPFDDGYRAIDEAIIFAVIHCGFVLRCARAKLDHRCLEGRMRPSDFESRQSPSMGFMHVGSREMVGRAGGGSD
jgi:hypothetical protein